MISAYAFHKVEEGGMTRAKKVNKATAISRVANTENTVMTMMWDYKAASWRDGEVVDVIGTGDDRYLRTRPDSRLTDNLAHLIDYDWVETLM